MVYYFHNKLKQKTKIINNQKEFIFIVSHELKTPIMSASFRLENIISNLNKLDNELLRKSLVLLKDQIYKVIDLVKFFFSFEKFDIFDIFDIPLNIEDIKLKDIIFPEVENLRSKRSDLKINFFFSESINFVELDRIQFYQVISNLLTNCFKFANKEMPIIDI
ncbi:MAG: hypothetical protein LBQ59_05895 [Candidatus Peribacteria bacterium]|nr:hypothetical protein [Candidatus Peribacteria bacterium]